MGEAPRRFPPARPFRCYRPVVDSARALLDKIVHICIIHMEISAQGPGGAPLVCQACTDMYHSVMNNVTRHERSPERQETALLWRLEHAGRHVDECREAALNARGLSTAKLGVLKELVQAGEPLPLGQLAARLTCVKSNITQLVDRLEREGLVQRVPDTEDRRCRRAAITEEGRRRAALGTKAEWQVEQTLLACLSRREQRELTMLLAKFELDGS